MPSLSQRILAVLGESPLSVTTPDIGSMCCPDMPRQLARRAVWKTLVRLERNELVVKVTSSNASNRRGQRPVRWALAK